MDNILSSAIDIIEIINNLSSKYGANGNAGVINIMMKKNNQNGFNGKVGSQLITKLILIPKLKEQ